MSDDKFQRDCVNCKFLSFPHDATAPHRCQNLRSLHYARPVLGNGLRCCAAYLRGSSAKSITEKAPA